MPLVLPSSVAVLGILLSFCVGSPSIDVDGVLPNHLGNFNFDELESSIYSVVVSAAPVTDEETLKNVDDSIKEPTSTPKTDGVVMVSNRGQRFMCVIPALQVNSSPSEKDDEEPVEKFPSMSDILSPLTERACLIKTVGWWTYEYCHGKFVRQYHLEAGSQVGKMFYLGYYINETVWTTEKIQALNESKRKLRSGEVNPRAFHSVYYGNGTDCDITGKPRKSQVKIMCEVSGLDRLADIQEVDTCSYVLIVHSSLLCDVPYFKREQLEEAQLIRCSPVVSKEKYQAYLERKEQSEIEAGDRADMDRSQSENNLLASLSAELSMIKEDTSAQPLGNMDERTELLYRLLASLVPDITDTEIEEQLEILRKKFKNLNNALLRELVKKLDQEQLQTREDKKGPSGEVTQGLFEKADPKEEGGMAEAEGVVEPEGAEEEEMVADLEVDDESLSSLEQAVTDEVKEKLSELGLPTDGVEVKLKVTTLELDDETKEELKSDQETSEEGKEDSSDKGEKKKSEVKVIRLTLLTDGNPESTARKRELEAKEKAKMSYLEQAYNFVWDNKQEEQRKRKQSQ